MLHNAVRPAARRWARPSSTRAYASAAAASLSSVGASSQLPAHLLSVPPTHVTTLSNKMRVASEYHHGETATVGLWIDAGSALEDDRTNGVAHFLEHMAFKGTRNRTAQQIELEIENMGGHLNAYTSREMTVYNAHVFKKDVPKAIEILADIVQNSNLSQEDVERERSTILREMLDVESQTNEVVFDHLHSIAFQGSSLGYTILGPEANIKRITRDDLVKYISTHYTAPRMVLAAAGAVDHAELERTAEKAFSGLSSEVKADLRRKPADFVGSMVHVRNDDIPLVHTAVALESAGVSDPNYFTFMVMQAIVGSWDRSLGGGKNMSSRVCEAFATQNLAHSVSSFNTAYHDNGMFGAYIVGEKEQTEDAVRVVMTEWTRLAKTASDFEVELAKDRLKATMLMQLDGTQAIAEDIGRQLLTVGRRLSPAEVFLRIDAVNAAKVREVASHYFIDTDPAVAAVGHVDSSYFPDYNLIRSWTNWNRL